MPLTFDLTDIADHETVCWNTVGAASDGDGGRVRINPVTEALVFHTVNVGIHRITEANADEFIDRVQQTEAVVGASLVSFDGGSPEPRPITADDVRAHIGLATNASKMTRRQWRTVLDGRAPKAATR